MTKLTSVKLAWRGEDVVVQGTPTCSPHFVIHRMYCGHGTWHTKYWRLTHVPSGQAAGNALRGKDARKILRILAAVLAAQPVDWAKADITGPDFAPIPRDIKDWARLVAA